MLASQSSGRRLAGKALIALTAAAALPLTASWATEYVDVPLAPGTSAGSAPTAAPLRNAPAALSAAAAAATAPEPSASPGTGYRENGDGTVTLPGGVKLDKGSTAFFAMTTSSSTAGSSGWSN